MESTLLKHLNEAQVEAVKATNGPILILAGAGSGKTRVLTYKAAYLILEKQVDPGNILLVTFTNKAANEMKQRINKLLSHSITLPFAGTFHSLCAKILRREGTSIGIPPDFIIYDEQDSKEAIREVIQTLDMSADKINPSTVATIISQAKSELITCLEYPQYARGFLQERAAKIYIEYQKILKRNHAVDFDDLLFDMVKLLREDTAIANKYQDKFHYVLVDEYQDTNHAQYMLTKLLAKRWRNICVVGDASQSIYSWRGADFRNISTFQTDFPDVKVFHLERNYRSTQKILDASYEIISKNRSHPVLKLWTDKDSGDDIKLFQADDEHAEAYYIVNEIANLRYQYPTYKYSDFVILYRTNAQSRVIEESFIRSSVPYLLVGGVRFYDRKEIKDVLSYVRIVSNPTDSISHKRAVKIGKKRYDSLLGAVEKLRGKMKDGNYTTLTLIDEVLHITSYLKLYSEDIEEERARLENIKELRSVATEFPSLTSFLENIALVEQEYLPDHPVGDDGKNAVHLMTFHAAKGLEFPTVFMVGMEEGLFPHSRTLMEPVELEEERRLCYVGMTRAIDKLYMTYTHQRLFFGQRTSNQLSRFITEIPEHLVTLTSTSY